MNINNIMMTLNFGKHNLMLVSQYLYEALRFMIGGEEGER